MTRDTRIWMTVAAGTILGIATLVKEDGGLVSAGFDAAIDLPLVILAALVFLLVPVVIARWWVVAVMAGPLLALLILQAAGVAVSLDDGTGPALNYRTLFQLGFLTVVMVALTGVRLPFDDLTRHREDQSDQPG